MISIIEAVFLSIVQGISEWLPISSSGHLAIFHNFFGFQNLSYDVFLHFAGIFAVVLIFCKDIIKLLNFQKKENLKYIGLIFIGLIPAGIIGILFKNQIENFFSSIFYLGIFFIISGVFIYCIKFIRLKDKKLGVLDSIFIGILQAIAILPGISRSGATISGGLFRGLSKEQAIKFSFLMAIPIILGASLVELKDLVFSDINYLILILSFFITFFVSVFTIKVLLKILKSDKFYLFGVYNFIVGVLVVVWSLVR